MTYMTDGRYSLTEINLLWRVLGDLRHDEVRRISTLTLLDTHDPSELFPHAVLPLKIVLLHGVHICEGQEQSLAPPE